MCPLHPLVSDRLRFPFAWLAGYFSSIPLVVMCTGRVSARLRLVPRREGSHEINLIHLVGNVRWLHMGSRHLGFEVSVPYGMGIVTFQAAGKQARQSPRDTPPGEHFVSSFAPGRTIEARDNNPGSCNDGSG